MCQKARGELRQGHCFHVVAIVLSWVVRPLLPGLVSLGAGHFSGAERMLCLVGIQWLECHQERHHAWMRDRCKRAKCCSGTAAGHIPELVEA